MSDIVISSTQRSTLLTLDRLSGLSARTQERVSTGRNVNSAVDDAEAFFRNRQLSSQAQDFLTFNDEIDEAITAVNAALEGISAVDTLVSQLRGVLQSARSNTDVNTRQSLNQQFDSIISQISTTVNDSTALDTNLINSTSSEINVRLNARDGSRFLIKGIDLNLTSVNSNQVSNSLFSVNAFKANGSLNFTSFGFTAAGFTVLGTANSNISALNIADTIVSNAVTRISSQSAQFSTSVSLLQSRIDFNRNISQELQSSADRVVEADLNEESTILTALQTRQQLSIQTLSIANQQRSAILDLFGR